MASRGYTTSEATGLLWRRDYCLNILTKDSFCESKMDHYEDVKVKKKRILFVPDNYTKEFYLDE
jgi:hypothetical protein